MDVETLWELFQVLARHVETLNREMGEIATSVAWIEWWVKNVLLPLTVVNSTVSVVDVVIKIRNNRNDRKKQD